MKSFCKTLILLLLTLSLVLVLFSCTNKKEEDESWLENPNKDKYAIAQKEDTTSTEEVHQSKDKVQLPTIPW